VSSNNARSDIYKNVLCSDCQSKMLKSENVTPNTGINSGFNGIGITGGP
jgi:hypothetical protein